MKTLLSFRESTICIAKDANFVSLRPVAEIQVFIGEGGGGGGRARPTIFR